jgi:hypothetical protein
MPPRFQASARKRVVASSAELLAEPGCNRAARASRRFFALGRREIARAFRARSHARCANDIHAAKIAVVVHALAGSSIAATFRRWPLAGLGRAHAARAHHADAIRSPVARREIRRGIAAGRATTVATFAPSRSLH